VARQRDVDIPYFIGGSSIGSNNVFIENNGGRAELRERIAKTTRKKNICLILIYLFF